MQWHFVGGSCLAQFLRQGPAGDDCPDLQDQNPGQVPDFPADPCPCCAPPHPVRDAAAGRDAFYEEYFDEGYYQPFTRSELATMLMDHNFLWDTAQDFFQWAKKAMGPQHRKKA